MAMVAAGFSGGEAEELRRAFGFKRSERRMREVEVKLRAGMERQGITGAAAEEIVRSITSFALYGFPESHAASFALLVYASAYLKAHYPAAFYTAMLNNQPMGFYHPATLVKDAQRRGVRFAPIDVERSSWLCTIERDGRMRLGLMYVAGLREEVGRSIEQRRPEAGDRRPGDICPKCGCDDPSMLEPAESSQVFCNVCSYLWQPASDTRPPASSRRFRSLDDFVARTGVHHDELQTLASIGALNAFGGDRRGALWQIERAVRPAGELYSEQEARGQGSGSRGQETTTADDQLAPGPWPLASEVSPLRSMTLDERIGADYAGTGLTIGPHPMARCRDALALRGVLRAIDLPRGRHGRRIRVAGAVITRQRPGTAKGFVFLTLEDETGIANIIVRPDLFSAERRAIISEPYLMIEGTLQIQEGVTSVKADRVEGLSTGGPTVDAHDFY
jgi:error-prone DNA polymerase